MSNKRKRLFVDPKLQGALLCRVLIYWTLCILSIASLAGLQVVFSNPNIEWSLLVNRILIAFGPALIASFIVLPFLAFDAFRFSLRFAGPMRRLRNVTQQLADGKWNGPINFREGDYWHDLAVQINRVGAELESLRSESAVEAKRETTWVAAE